MRLVLGALMLGPELAAAESLTSLEMVGRHAELAAAARARLAQGNRTASVIAPLCLAYSKLKDYRRLFPCLDDLDALVKAGDTVIVTDRMDISNSDATPFAGMLRAEALIELGDYDQAAAAAGAALDRVKERLPYGVWPPKRYRLTLLGTLGLASALAGRDEEARANMALLREFPIGFMGSATMIPYRDNGIARIHVALREYAKALPYLKDEGALVKWVYQLNDAAWGFTGADAVETFLLLPKLLLRGKCLLETGDLAGAKADLDAALRNVRVADFGELYWIVLYERGRIAEAEGRLDEALQFYMRAIDEIERQRSTISSDANRIGFVGDKQAVYGRLILLLVRQGRAEEAFHYVERSKSRALVDLLAGRSDLAARSVDPARVREILSQLDAAENASRIRDEAANPEDRAATRNLKLATDRVRDAAPELATLVTVSSVAPGELRALVGERETLVEYYVHQDALLAFVVSGKGIQAVTLDGSGLGRRVDQLRRSLQKVDSQEWRGPAQALHRQVWKPVEAMVPTEAVLVVAHGPLHYLPFAALHGAEGEFLVDRYGLRFLPAGSVLKFLRPPLRKTAAPLLALGNPDLGDSRLDLRFAEVEARDVASLFPESRVLVRKAASKSNFMKAAAAFSRIHFATHGEFQAEDPLNSGLRLAPDAGADDGLLTVGELYAMTLDTDLVTLSACETGLGKIASGDDVVGLTRGFLYAGSRSVVASLWSVDDRATSVLMKAFYDNFSRLDKREALRDAQRRVRAEYPHPFFWAAFQLTGRAD